MSRQDFTEEQIQKIFEQSCLLHQQDKIQEAEKGYRMLLEIFPKAFLLNYNLGRLLQEQQLFSDALKYYIIAAEDNPDDSDLLFNTGLCYKKTGSIENAIQYFHKSLQLQPESIDTLYNLGNCYRELNNFEKAAHYYSAALKLNNEYQPAISNLAYTFHRLEQSDKALALYDKLLSLNPEHKGAKHMKATITGSHIETSDSQYVTELFDDYSDDFEKDLIENLHYKVPQLLKNELLAITERPHVYEHVLDLGCGTGLAGIEIRDISNKLSGIDLSAGMIEKAKEKNIYDHLVAGDITTFLKENNEQYDLFLAADVFSYIGRLEETFELITANCCVDGLIAFSVETTNLTDGLELGKTGRFKHAKAYINKLSDEFNLKIIQAKDTELRQEAGQWVEGALFILKKTV